MSIELAGRKRILNRSGRVIGGVELSMGPDKE